MLEVGRGAPAAEGHHEEDDVMEAAVGVDGAAVDEAWGGDVVLEEEALGLRDGLEEGEEGVFVAGGETADENLGAVAEGDGLWVGGVRPGHGMRVQEKGERRKEPEKVRC